MSKRYLLVGLSVLAFVMSATAIASERSFFTFLDRYLEKEHYSINDDIRHVRMDGIDFWIPRNYNFGSYNSSDLNQVAVALQLLLPDFEPRTEENIKGFTEGAGWDDRITILMRDISEWASIEVHLQKRKEISGPFEKMKIEYSFDEAFRSKYPDNPKVILGAEFFVRRNKGQLLTYITCNIGRRVKDQGCTHNFMYSKYIMLKISYSRKYLSDWKEIERKAIELMKQFREKPQIGEPI